MCPLSEARSPAALLHSHTAESSRNHRGKRENRLHRSASFFFLLLSLLQLQNCACAGEKLPRPGGETTNNPKRSVATTFPALSLFYYAKNGAVRKSRWSHKLRRISADQLTKVTHTSEVWSKLSPGNSHGLQPLSRHFPGLLWLLSNPHDRLNLLLQSFHGGRSGVTSVCRSKVRGPEDGVRREDSGSGSGPAAPALEVKLGALALLLSLTLVFGISPLCLVRCTHNPDLRRRLLSLTSCFAGGVFFATCLLDLLPDYLDGINKAFTNAGVTLQFPLPEFIMSMGFFLVLVLEQILLSVKHSPSSSSSSSSSPPSVFDERRSLLDTNHIQTPDSPRLQRRVSDVHPNHRRSSVSDDHHVHVDFSSQSALRAFILVFSLSLHSVFEGLAVGLVEQEKEVLELCLALLIHKSIIALSLCFRLIQGQIRRSVVVGCLLLFSVMTPLGIAIGVTLTEETRTSPRQQIVRSSLEGLAAGTFIYITFMEILPHELQGSPRSNMPKVCMLLLGFALVTAVLFIRL
ncbi:hypothetical protein WMY93_026367 [Mugilogobius chulae]|uniref:Solute carrier family 39 member 1 n=1 Tax=Mugilogobius chulae TaxID=88201 RepID=A0AAW0N230_9GOBI